MTNKFVSVFGVGLLASALTSFSAFAATPVSVTLTTQVHAGSATLPAGSYVITELNDDWASPNIVIHSATGADTILPAQRVTTPTREPATRTRVMLRHSSEGDRLETIWIEGQELGYRLMPGAERR